MTLKISIVGLFPEIVSQYLNTSILGRAQKDGIFVVEEVQIRDFAANKHKNVDDTPCGGGAGMVMRIDVVRPALEDCISRDSKQRLNVNKEEKAKRCVILMDPAGASMDDRIATELADFDHLVFLCGRFEGIDARIERDIDRSISIGDYVLTGGEIAAAVICDATLRKREAVLGNKDSLTVESHTSPRLEHRQYTKPILFEQQEVPKVLLSGHHAMIEKSRTKDALIRTIAKRSDLIAEFPLTKTENKILNDSKIDDLAWNLKNLNI